MEISHLSSFFLLFLLFFSAKANRSPLSIANKFTLFLAISFIFELGTIITAANAIHNIWILKIFLFVELVYFNYYHRGLLNSSIDIKIINLILIVITVLSVLMGFVFNYIEPWFLTIFILYFIAQNCFILLSLFKQRSETLLHQNEFWVTIGRLSYFILILFIFFGSKLFPSIWTDLVFLNTFLVVNIAANFIRYSAYLKSFLVNE
jgi:hypothetical protein